MTTSPARFAATRRTTAVTLLRAATIALVASCGGGGGIIERQCALSNVVIAPSSASVEVGRTTGISAAVAQINCSSVSVSWSSATPGVATVSGSGVNAVVTGVAPGSAVVTATATAGSQSASGNATVAVAVRPVASVTIAGPSATTLAEFQQLTFSATALDADGVALAGRAVTWTSSAPAIVSISSGGTVTALSPGSTTIIAASEGRSSSPVTLTVVPASAASITLGAPAAFVEAGSSLQLTATVRDAQQRVLTGRPITWSSSSAVATINQSGLVTGVSPGAAVTLTASVSGGTGTVSGSLILLVTAATARAVEILPTTLPRIFAVDTLLFSAVTRDAAGNVISRPVTWSSSNNAVAVVSSSGVVRTSAPGMANIRATADGVFSDRAITVTVAAAGERFGYAFADRPTDSVFYSPAASTSFNATGGAIRIRRVEAGLFLVRFEKMWGQGEPSVALSVAAGPGASRCYVNSGPGPVNSSRDLELYVLCTSAGGVVDAPFRVTVVGSGTLSSTLPWAFGNLDIVFSAGNISSSWNSTGLAFSGQRDSVGVGRITYGLPALQTTDPHLVFITPINSVTSCSLIDRVQDRARMRCGSVTGDAVNQVFGSLVLAAGRTNGRFGMVLNSSPSLAGVHTPAAPYRGNSAGGAITINRTGIGVYAATFAGLGAGAVGEGLFVNVVGNDLAPAVCTVPSIARAGSDLTVSVLCYSGTTGAPRDAQFQVLVIN